MEHHINTSGAVLKWAREKVGLSIDKASELSGIPNEALHFMEIEALFPSVNEIKKLAEIYKVTVAILLLNEPPTFPGLIYISGRISEDLDHYIEKFQQAEKEVRTMFPKAQVINPIKFAEYIPKENYKELLFEGLKSLKHCDAIYMIHDFYKSKGAMSEFNTAIALGIEIYYQNRNENE